MSNETSNELKTTLQAARYGKDKVRVLRVVREGAWHHVVEYNVTALLEGDIDVRPRAVSTSNNMGVSPYMDTKTLAICIINNSVVVATDSIKNITYYLAKISPHVLVPEHFALHLGTHFVARYAHIHKAFITVEQLRWTRIPLNNTQSDEGKEKGHTHSFYRDGDDKRIVKVEVDASKGKDHLIGHVTSGISDLLVLKSTGSSFSNFVRDEYTTLAEVSDRIFSTAVDLQYAFAPVRIPAPADAKQLDFPLGDFMKADGSVWDAVGVAERARRVTLEVFAEDESASVQATLYKMAQLLLAQNAGVQSVTYSLPNKHFIPVDMRYIGVENVTPPEKAEVFMPISAPSGLISATISRK
ncbi:hypothetical protein D9615_010027 [Tricholomella constricta]|uniref:factor independent urate hydroxylase n=1 Tax=Tricholomella constricta TaxID=117010 RepID=A0A8H5LUZ5_9AGAR|nr:hypothetical protein D9615_010027 [Tricholomella constricta]